MSTASAASAASGALSRRRRRLTDRLNPILVKEVRQALRGRFFRVMFWLTLSGATLAGLFVIAAATDDGVEQIGGPFFLVIFGCLAAAVHGFTPFWAFLATGAEWEENTHDLLVLSNLRPRQIVLGKLLSALVQALLYYSTFGPFLVFAFLLNGVDLLSIGVLLAGSMVTCVGLTLVGIALASLAAVKAVRGLLMALFGAGLVAAWAMAMGIAASIARFPQTLRDPGGQLGVLTYVAVVLALGTLAGLVAVARFAHEEENRTTGLRVLGLAIVVLTCVLGGLAHASFSEPEIVAIAHVVAVVLLYLLWIFFLTEREALGPRAAAQVPARGWRALLAAPFLPGGGLAVLLFLTQAACALLGSAVVLRATATTPEETSQALVQVALIYGYAFAYVALPSALASFFVRTRRERAVARLLVLVLLPLGFVVPTLLGLLLGEDDWIDGEHVLNPLWPISRVGRTDWFDSDTGMAVVALALVCAVTLTINAKRVDAGVRGVLAASRKRRERARA